MQARPHNKPWKGKAISTILLILMAVIAAPIGYGIYRYGVDIPFQDEWEFAPLLRAYDEGSLTFKMLVSTQNEYRQLLPYSLFIFLAQFSHWQVKWQMAVSLLMVMHVGWMWMNILRRNRLVPFPVVIGIAIFAFTLLFTPSQYENWILGMQVVYFVPVYCLTVCLAIASKRWPLGQRFSLIALISLASTLSAANGFLCWIAMLPLICFDTEAGTVRRRCLLAGWISLVALSVVFYLVDFRQPAGHKALWQVGPGLGNIIHYFIRVVGNGLGTRPHFGLTDVSGLLILCCLALSCLLIWRYRSHSTVPRAMLPWLIMSLYGLLTAVLITVGRANMGVMQAFSPRYTGFTLFVALGAMVAPIAASSTMSGSNRLKSYSWAIAACMMLITTFKWSRYREDFDYLKSLGAYISQAKAGLLVSRQIPLEEHSSLLLPIPLRKRLDKGSSWLDERGWIRPGIFKDPCIPPSQMITEESKGIFESVHMVQDSLQASGRIDDQEASPLREAVILTYRDPSGRRCMVGIDNSGQPIWRVSAPIRRLHGSKGMLEAWLLDSETGLLRKMKGSHALQP